MTNTETVQYCYESVNGSCPKAMRLNIPHVPMYIFMTGTILFTITGNMLVIIAISHFKQLHTPTNLGCLVMPYSMVRSVEPCWYLGKMFCKIHSSCDVMLCTASILHLCFISIERYYTVCDPLRYKVRMTLFSVLVMIFIISWVVPTIFAFGVVFSEINLAGIENLLETSSCMGSCALLFNELSVSSGNRVFIPSIIMLGIYIKRFLVARKHARAIEGVTEKNNEGKTNRISRNKEHKPAKTLGLVMGIFLIYWVPFFITTIIDPIINFSTPPIIFDTFVWFGYFNSAFNPILYAFFYPWFHKALKLILSCRLFDSDSSTINLFPK
uniref:Trace amine associated receptor 1 n=1 Tax=Callorhinchus milii TaxID=7868 RepID=A0A4W3HWN5_CALMI